MPAPITNKARRQRSERGLLLRFGCRSPALETNRIAVPLLAAVREIYDAMWAGAHTAAVGQCQPGCSARVHPWRIARKMAHLDRVVVWLFPYVHREAFGSNMVAAIEAH